MKKLLLCISMLLMITVFAACAKGSEQPPQPPVEPPQIEQPATPEETEAAEPVQINIYHLGIITKMNLSDAQTQDLAARLGALLDSAAETDGIDTAPADSANPVQVMAGETALEVVYNQDIELPLQDVVTPIKARRMLYSIPNMDGEGGLLYVGNEIYEEVPIGKLFDQELQDAIYNSASDQVEKVTFSADGTMMEIDNQQYSFEKGEDAADLSDALLNRMLYRTIAFYLNAYTGNMDGLKMMSTHSLTEAIAAVRAGQSTENELGEQTIAELNKHVLAEYFLPEEVMAPVEQDGGYMISLRLNEKTRIQIHFEVEEEIPLVSALHLALE